MFTKSCFIWGIISYSSWNGHQVILRAPEEISLKIWISTHANRSLPASFSALWNGMNGVSPYGKITLQQLKTCAGNRKWIVQDSATLLVAAHLPHILKVIFSTHTQGYFLYSLLAAKLANMVTYVLKVHTFNTVVHFCFFLIILTLWSKVITSVNGNSGSWPQIDLRGNWVFGFFVRWKTRDGHLNSSYSCDQM